MWGRWREGVGRVGAGDRGNECEEYGVLCKGGEGGVWMWRKKDELSI